MRAPRPAVIVVGSLHYDIMVDAPTAPRKGETIAGRRWSPKFGGKGGNQAVAARCDSRRRRPEHLRPVRPHTETARHKDRRRKHSRRGRCIRWNACSPHRVGDPFDFALSIANREATKLVSTPE